MTTFEQYLSESSTPKWEMRQNLNSDKKEFYSYLSYPASKKLAWTVFIAKDYGRKYIEISLSNKDYLNSNQTTTMLHVDDSAEDYVMKQDFYGTLRKIMNDTIAKEIKMGDHFEPISRPVSLPSKKQIEELLNEVPLTHYPIHTLYFVTPTKDVERILKTGIDVDKDWIAPSNNPHLRYIYLFKHADEIQYEWKEWMHECYDDGPMTVLKVSLHDQDGLVEFIRRTSDSKSDAYQTNQNIPAKRISNDSGITIK